MVRIAGSVIKPFRLIDDDEPSFGRRLIGRVGERVLSLSTLDRVYAAASKADDVAGFIDRSLRVLAVRYEVAEADVARIAKQGPTVVVANHPYGGLEGIILARLMLSVRPDVKLMANHLLSRVPEFKDLMLFVDPFGSPQAARASMTGLRAAMRWLKGGGALIVFPAGTVSHLHLRQQRVTDPVWSDTPARLIRRTGATVVPMYVRGHNSALFQIAGLVHPRLRTLMLPHQLVSRRQSTIGLRVGEPIESQKLTTLAADRDVTEYLRMRTYILADADEKRSRSLSARKDLAPIEPAVDVRLLIDEIAGLNDDELLLESGSMQVYVACAQRVPNVLREIGRLREITFRGVGEGSGAAADLDHFDQHYLHLFVWDAAKQMIVGAYRMGQTDVILPRFGKRGLYTSTLFRYRSKLLTQIGPALELGRSFVRPQYQRSYSALLLLWKGIGHYVVRHPRYRRLFGPVSINDEYRDISQWMIVAFLKAHEYLPGLGRLIRPKRPPRLRPPRDWDGDAISRVVNDINDVSGLIAQIEADHKTVPILFKQYLKLGAKLLAFNVDPKFGHTLDGLMMTDLTQANPRVLKHYLTTPGLKKFLAYHTTPESSPARK